LRHHDLLFQVRLKRRLNAGSSALGQLVLNGCWWDRGGAGPPGHHADRPRSRCSEPRAERRDVHLGSLAPDRLDDRLRHLAGDASPASRRVRSPVSAYLPASRTKVGLMTRRRSVEIFFHSTAGLWPSSAPANVLLAGSTMHGPRE